MSIPVHHIIQKNTFWLSAQRCIYWEDRQSLILSDLHFGKTGHFRKSGIAVPQALFKEDLQRLFSEIQYYQPRQLLIVGDMFHSHENSELNMFLRWRDSFAQTPIQLIKGNHDILKSEWYEKAGITVSYKQLLIDQFLFTHDVCDFSTQEEHYCFTGHVHPGILIKGPAKQSLRLPCFYFGKHHAILPAFSKFTGLARINLQKDDAVYAILPNNPIKKENGKVMLV